MKQFLPFLRQHKNIRQRCFVVAAIISTALLLSPKALACSMIMGPSTRYSVEPVTIKIADTYFEIPEKNIAYGSPPAEVESIKLWIEVPPEQCQVDLMAKSLALSRKYPEHEVPSVTTDTAFLAYANCWRKPEVPKYLMSIASDKPPKTWASDLKLWESLRVPHVSGVNGCGQLDDYSVSAIVKNILERTLNWVSIQFSYSEMNVLAGLEHRNAVFRNRAMQITSREGMKSDKVKVALLKIAKSDIDLDLRDEATQILGSLTVDDKLLVSVLRDLAKDPNGKQGQSRAVLELAKVDPEFVEFIVPLIPDATPELTRAISSGLARVVEVEYQKTKPTNYDQFSPNIKKAIQAEMKMLFDNKDSATQYNIIRNFQSYKALIATPEYISFLNQLSLHNNLKLVEVGINALESIGLKPKDTPQVILHLEKFLELSYRNIYVKPMANNLIKKLKEPIVAKVTNLKNIDSDNDTKLRQIEWNLYKEDDNYWLVQE